MKQAIAFFALVLIVFFLPLFVLCRGFSPDKPPPPTAYNIGQTFAPRNMWRDATITLIERIENDGLMPAGYVWVIRRDDDLTTRAVPGIAFQATLDKYFRP